MTRPTGQAHAAPKVDIATRWLKANPALNYLSARRLASEVQLDGVSISYKTWALAKRKLKERRVSVTFTQAAVVLTTKDRHRIQLAGFPIEARRQVQAWALRRGYAVNNEKGTLNV